MAVATLAAAAIATLTPYLVAGATKAAETLGEELTKKTGTLLLKIRGWLAGDERSQRALKNFEEDAATYAGPAEKVLAETLVRRPELQAELQALMDGLGSRVVVRQRVEELAGTLVGVDVGLVRRSLDAFVEQDLGYVAQGATAIGARISET